MNYLIDTNIISELTKKQPEPSVISWFGKAPENSLYISCITIGEIRKGIEKLPKSKKKMQLDAWLNNDVKSRFEKRTLPITAEVADCWGRIISHRGKDTPSLDGLIAATAYHADLILVTRNIKDFEHLPVRTLNPWKAH
mgnify:CR=1 FL=1|jgi:toxin FitB